MGFFDKKPVEKKEPNPNEALEQMLKALPELIQQSVATGMAGAMKGMQQQQAAPPKQEEETPTVEPLIPEGLDLEELDNAGMLNLIFKGMESKFTQLEEILEPKFTQLNSTITTNTLKDQVKEVAKDNPEFWKYQEVMGGLAKKYPALAPQDLFDLAKTKAPEIGEALQKEKDDALAAENKAKAPVYGGLLPTSGASGEDTEGMTFEDASAKAWEEAMDGVPAEIIGGGNN